TTPPAPQKQVKLQERKQEAPEKKPKSQPKPPSKHVVSENVQDKSDFARPSQQQVVEATNPNYETMRGLSNAKLFDNAHKQGGSADSCHNQMKEAPDNEYEYTTTLDNVAITAQVA
ncbi:hypothetical protein COOONC_19424, partial [Cooperia oncophora]